MDSINIYVKQSMRCAPSNQLKSENVETLYLKWIEKTTRKIDYKKACSLMNKHEYQHSADILIKNIFKPFYGTGLFLYSFKYIGKLEVS